MDYNKNPISIREGHIFIDGVEVLDGVNATFKFTPDVWSGKQIGEQSNSSRWLGYSITGVITRRRSNNWLKVKIKEYQKTKATPELTIQGINDDKNSDFYKAHGSDITTLVGCVLTGDLQLTVLDSGGEVLDDPINFNAKELV